jgi:hypothetical protein
MIINLDPQKKPFFLPYVNNRIIILNKKPSKQSNTPQHKDSQIRLKFFGDYNNNFGVLTLNHNNNNPIPKQTHSPGFHNKFLNKVLNSPNTSENTLSFSQINLNKRNRREQPVKPTYNTETENKHYCRIKKPSFKSSSKPLSPLSNQSNTLLLRYLNNNTTTTTTNTAIKNNPSINRNISSLLTVKKIPKEIFRSTIQYAPRTTFNKKLPKCFNESVYSTSYNTISSNENPYY